MLRHDFPFEKVVLLTARTDMRKGIDGLVAIVRLAYGLDPIEKGTKTVGKAIDELYFEYTFFLLFFISTNFTLVYFSDFYSLIKIKVRLP